MPHPPTHTAQAAASPANATTIGHVVQVRIGQVQPLTPPPAARAAATAIEAAATETATASPVADPIAEPIADPIAEPIAKPISSAIHKLPVEGALDLGELGLAGDAQADARVHGGADKAVHCYPLAHYAFWRTQFPQHTAFAPGAFGENFCVQGMDEHSVCLGDEWQVGSARVAVSQARLPCHKLNRRTGVPDMAQRMQDSLRAGWYLRVLQAGQVRAGDAVALLHRPHPQWPLARLLAIIRDRDCSPATLHDVLALPLPARWRAMFERRLHTAQAEDWHARLHGTA